MICIIDYGMGNLRSVQKAFEKLGVVAEITSDPDKVRQADKVVLPGVGAFGACMANMRKLSMDEVVKEVIAQGKPFLGICLGLQMLFDVGEEMGEWPGLGILPGRVLPFRDVIKDPTLKVPHMGWNSLKLRPSRLFEGIEDGAFVYFVHSYYPAPTDESVISAESDYGLTFCAAVQKDNLYATQFHPEKSGAVGLKMLENFANLG
ncbi:MAG: imidazole glycerol phosphate synthase subunit HisH [bacterium]|jgi:glutamine amidotransferase